MQQIYRRTLKPKCDLNKAAKKLYGNHKLAIENLRNSVENYHKN